MSLEELRKELDVVDKNLRQDFVDRMKIIEKIADEKIRTGDEIYKPEREKKVIEQNSENVPEDYRLKYKAFIKKIMQLSRQFQYGRVMESEKGEQWNHKTKGELPSGVIIISFESTASIEKFNAILSIILDYGIKIEKISYSASDRCSVEMIIDAENRSDLTLLYQLYKETEGFQIGVIRLLDV